MLNWIFFESNYAVGWFLAFHKLEHVEVDRKGIRVWVEELN